MEARLRPWQDGIELGGEGVKYLKKLWNMTRDKRFTCWFIAMGCVPLTFYNAVVISPSATWSAAMVGLNVLMLLIAATETDDD